MIKILELTKKQTLILSAVTIALGIAFVISIGVFTFSQGNIDKPSFGSQPVSAASEKPKVEIPQVSSDAPVTSDTPTTIAQPTQVAPATPAAPKAGNKTPMQLTPATNPLDGKAENGKENERNATYTNKSVVPGDPLSYVGTYGQCPFYEDAGVKGCWPPKDIECNANWSVCTYKGN